MPSISASAESHTCILSGTYAQFEALLGVPASNEYIRSGPLMRAVSAPTESTLPVNYVTERSLTALAEDPIELGQGAFGRVVLQHMTLFAADSSEAGVPASVAVKMLFKGAESDAKANYDSELLVLGAVYLCVLVPVDDLLRADNACVKMPAAHCYSFIASQIVALPNGDMHTHLQHTKFAIPQVVQFTAHAVLAIDAMHQAGRVHSDMKPANMMLNSERCATAYTHTAVHQSCNTTHLPNLLQGKLVLIDLGGAFQLTNSAGTLKFITYTYCLPEAHTTYRHGPAFDYYSLGLIVCEFITRKPVFSGDVGMHDLYEAKWKVSTGEADFAAGTVRYVTIKSSATSSSCSDETAKQHDATVAHLIAIKHDFEERCSGFESLQVRDFIQQLLHWDPAQRLGNVTGGAAAVKAHPIFTGIDWGTLA
eukprot:19082-Heterococcus_DN1.PRE.1